MAELTLEQALVKITGLETDSVNLNAEVVSLKASGEESKREISTLNDKVRASEAAQTTLQDTIAKQTESLTEFDSTKTKYSELQETHTGLETRYTGSIHARLKGHGLTEDKYKDRSPIELEAMVTALDGVPNRTTNNGNPPAEPGQTGTGGQGGGNNAPGADDRGVIGEGSIADEMKIIKNAQNRNNK